MTAVLRRDVAAPAAAVSARTVGRRWHRGLARVGADLFVHAPTPRLALRANVPGGVVSTGLQR